MIPGDWTLLERAKYEIKWRLHVLKNNAAHAFPKYMGKKLRYWVLIYEGGRLMKDTEVVPEVKFMDILDRAG